MDIEFKEKRDLVEFWEINPGETFTPTFGADAYLKMEYIATKERCFNAVNMSNGDVGYFTDKTSVLILQNKLTVWY